MIAGEREKEKEFTRISNPLITTFQQLKKAKWKKMDHKLIFDVGLLRNSERFTFRFYAQLNLEHLFHLSFVQTCLQIAINI